jgi:hypothetical protein
MIRMFLAFFIVFFVMYYGIPAFRNLSGKDKWDLTKLVVYSTICAILSIVVLSFIVIIF